MTSEKMAQVLENQCRDFRPSQWLNSEQSDSNRAEHEAVNRCLKAGAASLRREEWKPISEAPKDGREILVWVPPFAEFPGFCTKTKWYKPPYKRGYWWDLAHMKPTHYRELPAPPEGV